MATKAEVVETIKKNILEILPDLTEDEIDTSKLLKDLGANSIDRMDIIVSSMESYSLNLPMMEFQGKRTVDDIAEVILGKIN